MAKTEMIRARVEPDLKRQAEELFSELGLSTTEAITLFYKQVTVHRGLLFDVRVPNAETIEALQQARDGDGLERRSICQSSSRGIDSQKRVACVRTYS